MKRVTTSAILIGSITIGMADYTGGDGTGPVRDIAGLELIATTGLYSIHLTTHPVDSTLSKAQIESRTGRRWRPCPSRTMTARSRNRR
jgi:hypothetical protein